MPKISLGNNIIHLNLYNFNTFFEKNSQFYHFLAKKCQKKANLWGFVKFNCRISYYKLW